MRHLAPVLLLLLILSPPDLTAGEFDGSWKGALIAEFGDRDGSCGFKKSPLRAHVENGRLRVTGIDLAQKEQVFEDEIAADGEFEAWGWWGIGGTTGGVATGRGKLSGLFLGTRSFLGEFYASLDGGGTCVAKVFLKRAPETAETEHGRAPTQRGVAFVAAARKGDLGAVEKALSDGTDVNARDGIGSTALMMAARRGDVALVRRLIDVGANPGLTNTLGQSAVILATKHGHKKVAAILRSGVASNIGFVSHRAVRRGHLLCPVLCKEF